MAAPLTGQIAVSGTAQVLSTPLSSVGAFTIKTPSTNLSNMFIGPAGVTTGTGFILEPGDQITYEYQDSLGSPRYVLKPSDLYVVGTGPDVVSWLASP